MRKHGHTNRIDKFGKRQTSREYSTWRGIWARCTNPNMDSYANYGGRGIKVCERWRSFENFLADMGEKPLRKSIDRIDANGDYSPENCRWVGWHDQLRNRRGASTSASGLKGVSKAREKWNAMIMVGGVQLYLGRFACKIEAARMYNEAAVIAFGGAAVLNDIPDPVTF